MKTDCVVMDPTVILTKPALLFFVIRLCYAALVGYELKFP